jgi:vitamin B12 transporter
MKRFAPTFRRTTLLAALLAAIGLHAAPGHAQRPDYTLDTLRVTVGSRASLAATAATRAVEVVTRADIERLPARGVSDVIARALGADLLTRSAASADLSLRGSGSEQVLVLVDGVPVRDDQTGHFTLDLAVPLDAVERVEIVRGGASALYGSSAVGGVVNVVTRGAATARARLEGGSFGSTGAGVALRAGGATARGGVSADIARSDGHRPGTDYDVRQLRADGALPLGAGLLRADAGYAWRDFGAADFYAPFPSWEETRVATASAGWAPAADAAFSIAPRVAIRRHHDDFVLRRGDPTFYRNVHEGTQLNGEVVARYVGPKVGLSAGGEAERSSLESTNLGTRAERRGAGFAELALTPAAAVTLTTGARYDRHEAFGGFLSPSLAAGWAVTPGLRLRAAASRGFRAPTWTDRFYSDPANLGDPDLRPERFTAAEIGFRASPRAALTLDGALWLRHATELIDWVRPLGAPAGTPWQVANITEATFRGAELSARVSLPDGAALTARGAWIDVETPAVPGRESKYALRPLSHTVALGADAPLGARLALAVETAHARRTGNDAWLRVDARVRLDAGHGFELRLDGSNLTDARPTDVTGLPAAGRAFSAGVVARR